MMLKLCAVAVTWFSLAVASEESLARVFPIGRAFEGRVVGGEETSILDHPYQASMQYFGYHYCGGAVISEKFVVSAAHCMSGLWLKLVRVRVGSSYSKEGGLVVDVNSIIVHESYNESTSDCDIALLKLRQTLKFTNSLQPIGLPSQDLQLADSTSVVVTGWGVTSAGSYVSPTTLREVTVSIINQEDCIRAYPVNTITDRMLCAGVPGGGRDACQGDSGGPLVANGTLVGIVSWGIGCARPNYPGVYTRVSKLRAWIHFQSGV